jgi:hypothetical protein
MLRSRADHTLLRVLAIYLAGFVAGIQVALYLFDRYDDGVADVRSLLIGLLMVGIGLGLVAWKFRRAPDRPTP